MCNAYSISHAREEVVGFARHLAQQHRVELDEAGLPSDWRPRYRISPRQRSPILRLGDGGRLIWSMPVWGLRVDNGKPGFAPTNARDDKLVSGWPWKMISRRQRCLVPTDGFFEPEKKAGSKERVPWSYYTMRNRQLFLMAGLWNQAADRETGEIVESYAVVTTSASPVIRVHDRMVAVIDEDDARRWLEPGDVPVDLLKPYPAERMAGWRVVDEARNSRVADHPGLIEPVDTAA